MSVRIGLAGYGVIGRIHAAAIGRSAQAELAAVADIKEDVRSAAVSDLQVPVYASISDMLEHADIDAVTLAFPAEKRADAACEVLSAGKHVLIEKPIAMNAEAADRIIAAKPSSSVAACASMRFCLLPSSRAAQAYIASGKLGAIRSLSARTFTAAPATPSSVPPTWRLRRTENGGGIMMNLGCYDLNYLFGLAGWNIRAEEVLARSWQIAPAIAAYPAPGSDAETHLCGSIACSNGIICHIERGEYMACASASAISIIGDKGTLSLSMFPGEKTIYADTITPRGVERKVIWSGTETWDDVHRLLIEEFASSILERRSPETSIHQAREIQRMTDALYASSLSGSAASIASQGARS